MARKKSFFGTMLVLGGIAAAGVAVYKKRDEIKTFFKELTDSIPPADEEEWEEEPEPEETDIVIDRTAEEHEDRADSEA